MPAGRPTEYDPVKTTKLAREYIENCEDKYVRKSLIVDLPVAAGLALYLGVNKKTLYEWAQKYDEFGNIMAELNAKQEKMLLTNGLSGKYNSTISKLVLSKHGYKEQIGLSGEEEGDPIRVDLNVNDTISKIYGSGKDAD